MKSKSSFSVDSLFKPFTADNLELSNRIVMAPMTRGFSLEGVPGNNVAEYYRRRAANDVGLIITEGTLINHPAAAAKPNSPNFYGKEALNGWSHVVNAVHDAGGRIFPQLWHVGMERKTDALPNAGAKPIGPSGLDASGEKVTKPMSESEIADAITAYAQAAEDAKRLGFDGIELHGAHGYLIDQFFWDRTNKRTDQYGGNLAQRTRFAAEVIKACRNKVGSSFPISFRFSQWKVGDYSAKLANTPHELEQFLTPLTDAGVDIFHCSTRRFWEAEFEGSDHSLSGWTKKLTGKPVISVGSVSLDTEFTSSLFERKDSAHHANFEILIEMLEKGEFDFIAVGRALLMDPAWAIKVKEERMNEILPFSVEALNDLK
ncbi:NADH:flavin oxidoreductase [Paenibacillus humicola]|uniref:NADH:flavin oxidoreductase n=1 Tax=Paenibacillus humicola TaxID=3110540 RepID=UPI00237B89C2|nr:NADH:flavin oxidoreductase [Paenibacillus humicola]